MKYCATMLEIDDEQYVAMANRMLEHGAST
jgi:hypothetical protein